MFVFNLAPKMAVPVSSSYFPLFHLAGLTIATYRGTNMYIYVSFQLTHLLPYPFHKHHLIAVTFIPKTIRTLITSSAESDGKLTVTARRQLKQQADRRKAATIQYEDQRADDLTEVDDESVDIVISLQAAERMRDNGLDWKKSVQEAARVLKPGGRLLFVEATNIDGVNYLDYVQNLYTMRLGEDDGETAAESDEDDVRYPVFDEVGSDDVDLVIVPHVAGVAIKAMDAGLTPAERAAKAAQEEKDRLADLSIAAFERGNKKRRKKKKKTADEGAVESA